MRRLPQAADLTGRCRMRDASGMDDLEESPLSPHTIKGVDRVYFERVCSKGVDPLMLAPIGTFGPFFFLIKWRRRAARLIIKFDHNLGRKLHAIKNLRNRKTGTADKH